MQINALWFQSGPSLHLSSTRPKADPFGQRNEFRQGFDLHFFHHSVAVGLHRACGTAHRLSDLLVLFASNDKLENFPLAWRQSTHTGAHGVQFVLQTAYGLVVRESLFNRAKEVAGRYRLDQEVIRPCFDSPHRGGNVGVASEEYDWQR